MKKLQKGRGHLTNTDTKYYINCSSSVVSKITSKELIAINDRDVTIIKAVLDSYQHFQNKHIVVKLGLSHQTVKKEYDIGVKLKNIPGYIKYICLFECLDSTHKTTDICTDKDPNKHVIIAPYIKNGSVRETNWKNYNKLKSILKQCVLSLLYAYNQFGFVHNDLHLDNILFCNTTKTNIDFKEHSIVSHGVKTVLIDFDMSFIGLKTDDHGSMLLFWRNLENFFVRLQTDFKYITTDMNELNNYIVNAIRTIQHPNHSTDLLNIIDRLIFTEKQTYKLVYDPNQRV
uniref:Protein kinase domain-containing protein n=1 Tax=Pyramimonas orientalis virus TaxID=455367 RepID=A0A7M3UP12_POV01|nr:hypothetical protein HWQ62_00329 [Pyramimonas orientalis virus]